MRPRIVLVALAMAVVAACAGATDEPSDTTTTVATSTTATPTTAASTTSTTRGDTSTTSTTSIDADVFAPEQPITLAPPASLEGADGDGSSGSGCHPGDDPLKDGVWFGFLLENNTSSVDIDIACLWFGDIAYEVAEAAGEQAENDVWIGNSSDRVREVPIDAETVVWTIAGDPTLGHRPVTYAEWPISDTTYTPCPGELCTVWLYVNGGVATDIVEQYLP